MKRDKRFVVFRESSQDINNTIKYYLAHPFDSRHRIRKWELKIERETGIELINPFFDIPYLDNIPEEASREVRYKDINENWLIHRDVGNIARVDVKGIIAVIDGALSYGTIQEMVYTKMLGKDCLSLITNGHNYHPWLKYHSTKIFTKRKELEEFLKCQKKKLK